MDVNQDLTNIRFSTQILRRLGEELNPSIEQSIIELIKNAYDADATICHVALTGIQEPGGTVVVTDNGRGMTAADIKNGWLVIGRSSKISEKLTELGRVPSGSKGLGRLAALRMGKKASVTSYSSSAPHLLHSLVIDWERFERAELVEDVILKITSVPDAQNNDSQTSIKLEDIRTGIGRREIKRLARGMLLLTDPFTDDPAAFKASLSAPEFADLEKLVNQGYFDEADYHLTAHVDPDGYAFAQVLDWKGDDLFSADHKELAGSRSGTSYRCPAVSFDLWAFLLSKSSYATKTASLTEVRRWLSEFGGVHLYENGLRVSPYGNPGNDWLDMNLSRTRSPEERPSTNNSIGRVSVSDSNDLLQQKTDRSGYIETDAFEEIRAFCQDALNWMARRRLEAAEQRRSRERKESHTRSEKRKEAVEALIQKVPEKTRVELEKTFRSYEKAQTQEINALKKEVQLYRTLSTAGIISTVFAHEVRGNPTKVIQLSINTIERRCMSLFGQDYKEQIGGAVDGIRKSVQSYAVLGDVTLDFVSSSKRRLGKMYIHTIINNVVKVFAPLLVERNIEVVQRLAKASPYLRASEAAIESIIANLLNNSMAAFARQGDKSRVIVFETSIIERSLILRAYDSGPGIIGISPRHVWLPGQTTKENGTGLGLTIVRDTVVDIGGHVQAVAHGELGGAEFQIEIPILGH